MQSHSQDHCQATLFVRSQQSAEESASQIQEKNGANVLGTLASGTDSFNTNSSEFSSQQKVTADYSATTQRQQIGVCFHQSKRQAKKITEEESSMDDAIVADMLNGCEDDTAGFYFNEFGGGLEGTSANKAPLE